MADTDTYAPDALTMDTYIVAGSHAALLLLGVMTLLALSTSMGA